MKNLGFDLTQTVCMGGVVLSMILSGCSTMPKSDATLKDSEVDYPKPSTMNPAAGITKSVFGTTPEGQTVEAYTLVNGNGVQAKIITFGA